jgi:hypothetical protein
MQSALSPTWHTSQATTGKKTGEFPSVLVLRARYRADISDVRRRLAFIPIRTRQNLMARLVNVCGVQAKAERVLMMRALRYCSVSLFVVGVLVLASGFIVLAPSPHPAHAFSLHPAAADRTQLPDALLPRVNATLAADDPTRTRWR